MNTKDWKLVLQKCFDKKIVPNGNPVYTVTRAFTIRADGKDFRVALGCLIYLDNEIVTVENDKLETDHIKLDSFSAITFN